MKVQVKRVLVTIGQWAIKHHRCKIVYQTTQIVSRWLREV
jgi:hypothetical protein